MTVDCRLRYPGRPPPLVEHIEHVGLTEIDPDRTPARTLTVVALEVPIDTRVRHPDWDAAFGPARHQIEGRPRDTDQMTVVLATEVGLDLPAEFRYVWFRSHTSLRPRRVRSGSTCTMAGISGAITSASPPVAIHSALPPSSSLMRRARPSTMPT